MSAGQINTDAQAPGLQAEEMACGEAECAGLSQQPVLCSLGHIPPATDLHVISSSIPVWDFIFFFNASHCLSK